MPMTVAPPNRAYEALLLTFVATVRAAGGRVVIPEQDHVFRYQSATPDTIDPWTELNTYPDGCGGRVYEVVDHPARVAQPPAGP